MSIERIIDSVDVFVVANPQAHYRTSAHYGELQVTNTIVRVRSGEDFGVGAAISWTEGGADTSLGAAIRHVGDVLIGKDAIQRERLHAVMMNRCASMVPLSVAPLDIALWDLTAKAAGLPLHRMLGGYRDEIPAYASTPFHNTLEEYIRHTAEYLEQGYRAIKFHTWCYPDQDLELVNTIAGHFGTEDVTWMLDVEGRYTRHDALRVGRRLEELGYCWFEAPLPDHDLAGYQWLREKLEVEVIPAGNEILNLNAIADGIAASAWDHVRVDVTLAGGITGAQRVMALARAHSMNVELQSWGHTLSQAANLHVMLANANCRYFEQAMPIEPMEYAVRNPIRVGSSGKVTTGAGPGLGVEVDWDLLERDALERYTL
jgi:L-alanine-DL-glutamate epimerase-like enolase superfamily enzyme